MRRSRRSLVAAATAALIATSVITSTASAAAVFTFSITITSTCVYGTGPTSTQHTITLYTSSNEVRGRVRVMSDTYGSWSACFDYPVGADDKVRAAVTGSGRTVTVPRLTLSVNRVSDLISGQGPANKPIVLNLTHYTNLGGSGTSYPQTLSAVGGAYSWDTTALADIQGADYASATYTNITTGDSFRITRYAPFMTIQRLTNYVSGYLNAYASATLTLKTSANAVRGRAAVAASHTGSYSGYFASSLGNAVYPRRTDKVSGSFATDANVTVPDIKVSGVASTDVVTGTCMANAPYQLYAQKANYSDWAYRYGTTDGSGNLTEDLTADINVAAGDSLQLLCRYPNGDRMLVYGKVS